MTVVQTFRHETRSEDEKREKLFAGQSVTEIRFRLNIVISFEFKMIVFRENIHFSIILRCINISLIKSHSLHNKRLSHNFDKRPPER